MTDAELLELYVAYYDTFTANMAVMMTLIFAYLIATFVSAKKLKSYQFYATSVLFAVFTYGVVMGAVDTSARAASLQVEIVRRISEEGSQIGFVSTNGMPEFVPSQIFGLSIVSIFLAIGFAITQRHRKP